MDVEIDSSNGAEGTEVIARVRSLRLWKGGDHLWDTYRLAREAMLNGHYPLATRVLSSLLHHHHHHQRPTSFSETTGLWLTCLWTLCKAEETSLSILTNEGSSTSKEAVELSTIRPLHRQAIALAQRLEETAGPAFNFNRRFMQARLDFLVLMATLRYVDGGKI